MRPTYYPLQDGGREGGVWLRTRSISGVGTYLLWTRTIVVIQGTSRQDYLSAPPPLSPTSSLSPHLTSSLSPHPASSSLLTSHVLAPCTSSSLLFPPPPLLILTPRHSTSFSLLTHILLPLHVYRPAPPPPLSSPHVPHLHLSPRPPLTSLPRLTVLLRTSMGLQWAPSPSLATASLWPPSSSSWSRRKRPRCAVDAQVGKCTYLFSVSPRAQSKGGEGLKRQPHQRS